MHHITGLIIPHFSQVYQQLSAEIISNPKIFPAQKISTAKKSDNKKFQFQKFPAKFFFKLENSGHKKFQT